MSNLVWPWESTVLSVTLPCWPSGHSIYGMKWGAITFSFCSLLLCPSSHSVRIIDRHPNDIWAPFLFKLSACFRKLDTWAFRTHPGCKVSKQCQREEGSSLDATQMLALERWNWGVLTGCPKRMTSFFFPYKKNRTN
jgi:hypothetical protein